MAFGQGSRVRMSHVAESTYGTTPGSPTMTEFPFVTHSLALSKDRVAGQDIQADRMTRVDRHGNRRVVGDIVVDMRDTDYDFLLESAMFSSFNTAGVLEVGTELQSFTLEDASLDISEYNVYSGCAVSTMALRFAVNQMIRGTFTIVGSDEDIPSGQVGTSYTAASGGEPWDTYTGSISEGGSGSSIVLSVDLNLNNSLSPTFVIGSDKTPQLEFGRAEVEGTMRLYYENEQFVNKFRNEVETNISIVCDDPVTGGQYTFFLPRVKINGAPRPVANPQSRIIEAPFVALRDSSEGTSFRITKT